MRIDIRTPSGIDAMLASALVPVLDPMSPNAAAIRSIFLVVLLISLAIFVVVVSLIGLSLVRFRSTGEVLPKQAFGSHVAEIFWTLPPLFIVLSLGVASARLIYSISAVPSRQLSPTQPADIVVVGHQWWWEVRYPRAGAITANEIHVPIGKKLCVQVDSADVIHSFWMPQLGPKVDMVPGQHNFLWLEADSAGTYDGACSEFCGDQHAWMRFIVIAEPEAQYQAWLVEQAKPAGMPDGALALAGRSFVVSQTCLNCHQIRGTNAAVAAGPDLTHVASRHQLGAGVMENTPETLERWLANPGEYKPGCMMPNFTLNDVQLQQVTAYLESLR
jgi:cytochrome c oxidase subunit II